MIPLTDVEIHYSTIYPFSDLLRCWIKFFSCKFPLFYINPFKHHQVQIEDDLET